MKFNPALLFLLLAAICGCGKSSSNTLITSGFDEKEMDAAIARARSEVDLFLGELANPTGTSHAVKVPIQDQGATEHFWITDVTFANGEFRGTINNEPGMVSNVKMGQAWTVKKSEISDWMYMKNGKMHGNYTMRPLLKTMPPEEAEKLRSILATP